MHVTSIIRDKIEKFNNVSLDIEKQHVDARDLRVTRYNTDVSKFIKK